MAQDVAESRSLNKPELAPASQETKFAPRLTPCMRVEDVDFNNATFESDRTLFSFHHGKARRSDCPDCGEQSEPWDWKANIEKDVTLNPSPDVTVRFLLVHDEHMTGSGWWYHLVGFRCAPIGDQPDRKQLVKVFDRTAMSLRIETLTTDRVTVSITERSGHQYPYRWDVRSGSFRLQR